jgi:hypothetical protein
MMKTFLYYFWYYLKVYVSIVVVCLVLVKCSHCQFVQDSFCKYTMEQAEANRDILRTPSALTGFVQPAGVAPELVFGATSSLSGIKQSGLTMKAATTTCTLQRTTVEAQQAILYALPTMERDAVLARAQLVGVADLQLNTMEAEANKMVDAQNLTRPAVYFLRQARVGLDISVKAPSAVPVVSSTPLRVLIGNKMASEEANQKALAHLSKQTSWDFSLSAGVHRQVTAGTTPTSTETGPYGTFTLSYNLARKATNRHIDKSVAAYVAYKGEQVDDVAQQALLLKKQLETMVSAQQVQLVNLRAYLDGNAKDLKSLEGVETSNALMFRNQLLADQVVLGVEMGDVQFRLNEAQRFLIENF